MIESIVLILAGVLLLAVGILIGAFHKISLLHNYHYQNVRQEERKAYTAVMGIGLCLLGLSLLASAAVHLLTVTWIWIAMLFGGLAVGFAVIWYAQRKYNGGFFS